MHEVRLIYIWAPVSRKDTLLAGLLRTNTISQWQCAISDGFCFLIADLFTVLSWPTCVFWIVRRMIDAIRNHQPRMYIHFVIAVLILLSHDIRNDSGGYKTFEWLDIRVSAFYLNYCYSALQVCTDYANGGTKQETLPHSTLNFVANWCVDSILCDVLWIVFCLRSLIDETRVNSTRWSRNSAIDGISLETGRGPIPMALIASKPKVQLFVLIFFALRSTSVKLCMNKRSIRYHINLIDAN